MSTAFNLPKDIAKDSRYFPTVIGALILGLLLLFHENLSDKLRLYLIPSLAMYIAGTALLAYLQTMLRERRMLRLKENEKYTGIPNRQFRSIVISHFLLFASLIVYNLYRGSL